MDSKSLKPSSQTEEVPHGKKPGAKSGLKRKQSSKHTSDHPSPPTPVVGEMDKEAQQAAGVPTSLGATSKEGAHPQLSSSTNEESRADDISKKIKLKDLSEFLKDIRSALFTLDSPQDDPIIVTYESEEKEADKEDTHDTSHDMPEDTSVPPPSSPKSAQIQELMAQARHSYPDVNQLTTLLIKTRMEYLDQTEEELKIDFNKPLKEQDPLNDLNELANKKIKRTSDLKDHSRIENVFVSLLEVYKAEKRIVFYVKKSKANSLGNVYSEFGIDYNNFPQRIVPITRKKTCAIKMELSATHVMLANIAMINL
ncbi:hypothetical protein Tco_0353326 [Tanacetum coccineum]